MQHLKGENDNLNYISGLCKWVNIGVHSADGVGTFTLTVKALRNGGAVFIRHLFPVVSKNFDFSMVNDDRLFDVRTQIVAHIAAGIMQAYFDRLLAEMMLP